ncbi:hypothetical protein B0H17DRAFT_959075 [Mycena rosella]|uniref:Uncharacterized protein n=1 Tax=Mycena rosella TaxID=1033263 RepID=A0AAD7CGV9_MYCRO|nr:hypothetical protein B0H17DRAFT_959075 [Mycena rosella]
MSSKFTTVTHATSKLPTFHHGEVTPLACSEFQDGCSNYFAHKDTAPAKQVSIILGCFEDMKINNWTHPVNTCRCLTTLAFNEFMTELHQKFLKPDWKEAICKEVLSSRMKETKTLDI